DMSLLAWRRFRHDNKVSRASVNGPKSGPRHELLPALHPDDLSEPAILVEFDPEGAMNATMRNKRAQDVGRKADSPAACVLCQNVFARTLVGLQILIRRYSQGYGYTVHWKAPESVAIQTYSLL